ncbi:hypothetical protein CJ199_16095, partial [Brevibacterium paucivorans]
AEQAAQRWEQTAKQLDAQRARHRDEYEESIAVLRRAEKEAGRVRAEVAAPLVEQAEHDGAAYLATVEAERTASVLVMPAPPALVQRCFVPRARKSAAFPRMTQLS